MRSGFSTLAEPVRSQWSDEDWNVAQAALLVFTEDSMVMAKEYAALQGHPEATVQDIVECLKAKTRQGLASSPQFMERIQAYKAVLESMPDHEFSGEGSSSESGSDDSNVSMEEAEPAERLLHTLENAAETPAAAASNPEMVRQVRQYVETWEGWVPQNDVEAILKQAVDNTANAFQQDQ